MADLIFFTGPMDCGKSTLALQVDYTQRTGNRRGQLFTTFDRSGEARITSRIGLERDAIELDPDFSLWDWTIRQLTTGHRLEYLVCDEAQFYTPAQIDDLARIVDELQIDVFAFGILADFRTQLFPGSKRLVELCDRLEALPVQPLCWCGARGTHNARTVNGQMVTEGDQVVVGDTGAHTVGYEVLCRRHHRRRVARAAAGVAQQVDPLPLVPDGDEPDPEPDGPAEDAFDEFPVLLDDSDEEDDA